MRKVAKYCILICLGGLLLIGIGWFALAIIVPLPRPDLEAHIEYVLDPTPQQTTIKEIAYSNRWIGDSFLCAELTLTDKGKRELMNRYAWHEISIDEAYLLKDYLGEVQPEKIYYHSLSATDRVEIALVGSNKVILASWH